MIRLRWHWLHAVLRSTRPPMETLRPEWAWRINSAAYGIGKLYFAAALASSTTSATAPSEALLCSSHLIQPRTYEWNIAVEQSLGASQSISFTYIGADGRDLLRTVNLFNPNPDFQLVQAITNTAFSYYNALQLKYQRRFSRGLQALASYTFSHSTDTASTDAFGTYVNTPTSSSYANVDHGNSDFDIRHSF